MMRITGWEQRLDQAIAAAKGRRFEMGVNDCYTFACACAEAVTGINPSTLVKATYRSRHGALNIIGRRGGVSAAITGLIGRAPLPSVREAQRGDWLIYPSAAGDALAVCLGIGAVGQTAEGLEHVRTVDCRLAWRIG